VTGNGSERVLPRSLSTTAAACITEGIAVNTTAWLKRGKRRASYAATALCALLCVSIVSDTKCSIGPD
jgi:hypothetical protein